MRLVINQAYSLNTLNLLVSGSVEMCASCDTGLQQDLKREKCFQWRQCFSFFILWAHLRRNRYVEQKQGKLKRRHKKEHTTHKIKAWESDEEKPEGLRWTRLLLIKPSHPYPPKNKQKRQRMQNELPTLQFSSHNQTTPTKRNTNVTGCFTKSSY